MFDYNLSAKKVFKNNHMTVSLKVARPQTTLKPSETLEFFRPSGTCLRNLHHHTRDFPEPSTPAYARTLRNLPETASGTYTSACGNPAETTPALRNLPELAPGTYTSARRNPPEPPGTFLRNPHLRTPELIWAEDPISLRCWGNTKTFHPMTENHALPI